jgi:hypothetical protein
MTKLLLFVTLLMSTQLSDQKISHKIKIKKEKKRNRLARYAVDHTVNIGVGRILYDPISLT